MSGHGAQSDEILETEQKLYDFHKTIETIKLKLKEKRLPKKTTQSDEKKLVKNEKLSEEKQDPNKS